MINRVKNMILKIKTDRDLEGDIFFSFVYNDNKSYILINNTNLKTKAYIPYKLLIENIDIIEEEIEGVLDSKNDIYLR